LRKIIVCDPDKCNGCRICEYACAYVKEKNLNPRSSRIKVARIEPIFNAAVSCVSCEKPDCVSGCPTQAIKHDKKSETILIDDEKCVACGLCAERCRYGSITMSAKTVIVCDFCEDRKIPACVEFCPKEALSFEKPGKSMQATLRDMK
jgi:anaerobic carbon-monoxide dehydrogenase iron sulfur subunit